MSARKALFPVCVSTAQTASHARQIACVLRHLWQGLTGYMQGTCCAYVLKSLWKGV